MTRDTDPTPPHGIPRPSLSPLDEARAYLMDEMANAFTLYPAEQVPAVHAPMQTLADLLDIAEAFPSLWHAGEADALEGIADDLARMAGARRCPSCEEMRHPDDFGSWVRPICDLCAEDETEEEPAHCDGCNRVPAFPTADGRYALCLRCADQLAEERSRPAFPYREGEGSTPSGWERVKDAPAHPFGGAADR